MGGGDDHAALLHKTKKKKYDTFGKREQQHPEKTASIMSKLFMSWCEPLLKLGRSRQLQLDDTWPLTKEMQCYTCTEELLSQWDGSTSLAKSIWSTYGWKYMAVGLLLAGAYICDFFGPIVLKNVVEIIQEHGNVSLVWNWLIALLFSRLLKSIFFAHFYFQTQIIMLRFTSAMKGFVYRKALRLNAESRAEKNTGDIVNIYTTDVANIINAAFNLHYMWVLPAEIVAALYMLYSLVGNAMWAGLGTIVAVLLINNIIAKFQASLFEKIMKVKDERMKVVNEIFGAIQIVKLNAWESKFREKLAVVRTKELGVIWKYMRLVAVNIFLLWGAPVFVSTITFTVYAGAMNQTLTASKVFASIALFKLLQEPLRQLSQYITGIIQALVSVKRLKEFSKLEEICHDNVEGPENSRLASKYVSRNVAVAIENGSFAWDSKPGSSNIFERVNLEFKHGEFVVIHGRVGSGKSSLCSALLGEMIKKNGSVYVDGSVAYCPQQSWIQNMTIRENILFGSPYDEKKYKKVIEACGLVKDLKIMDAGDKTEIGEKGLNVSGGQKARISLARACYSDADIFIFDSPLSAVDAIVQNEIFTKCFLGLLRDKTRILVSHNPDIIESKHVDHTLELGTGSFNCLPNASKLPYDLPTVSPLIGSRAHQKRKNQVVPVPNVSIESNDEAPPQNVFEQKVMQFHPIDRRLSSFAAAQGSTAGQLVAEENRSEGRVSGAVFSTYFKAIGGMPVVIGLILVQIVWQCLQIGSDFWLSYWTSESEDEQASLLGQNIFIYASLALGGAFMVFVRTWTVSSRGVQGARTMFDAMTDSLMKAPMSFYDANPLGRQLNRYSDDVSNVDFRLPFAFGSALAVGFSVAATLFTAAVVTRFLGFIMVPLLYVYLKIGAYYLATAREIQRLQKVTQSPVLAHVSESVDGSNVIRAFGSNQIERFIRQSEKRIDANNTNQYAGFVVAEWFALRMQLMGGLILFLVTASLTLLRNYLSPGVIGLAFNYGLAVDQGLESLIQIWSYLEMSMVSPERISEYIGLPSEAAHVIPSTEPKASWPDQGQVSFEHVSFRYKEGGDLVLKDLSFDLKPAEKIGIVGRTGAGKSSLTMALFRINEICGGRILIDGIDTSKLGLQTLRSRLSIITQAPVLFKGTIRTYLDPFDEFQDAMLWDSLRKVQMADAIASMDGKLQAVMEENGDNFSVGERQMLCMARALLSESRVVIMDEATAAIDQKTDAILQKVIRQEFTKSTVITIAHRLDTVLDADRIMVLDAGRIVEFDSPVALIQRGNGHFFDLAKEGGYLERMNI